MRRLIAQWSVQVNGFIFGTCVLLSYQSYLYLCKVRATTRLLSVQL